jgi:hypothetical protein
MSALLLQQASLLAAQGVPTRAEGASLSVSISLNNTATASVATNHKYRVGLSLTNISGQMLCFPTSSRMYRVHLEVDGVEPAKTEMYRHFLGDYRKGDTAALLEGPTVCPEIAPDGQLMRYYDLDDFYDLGKSGHYSVWLDVLDEPQGPREPSIWLRTNLITFDVAVVSQ